MTRRNLALAAIVVSLIASTAAPLARLVRQAFSLRKLSLYERRVRLLGNSYAGVVDVLRHVAPNEPLALVARVNAEGEDAVAVFFNYYAYPHITWTYLGLPLYALDRNPHRPKTLVGFRGGPHLTTYAALRAESMTGAFIDVVPPKEARREMLVPFVASVDGPPPDMYTVEALLETDRVANVDVILYPSGAARRFVVHRRVVIRDLHYEVTRDLGVGWARIRSDAPLHVAFALVNRGTGAVTPIRIVDSLPSLPIRFPPRPNAFLWLLNVDDQPLVVTAGGTNARIPPHGIIRVGNDVEVRSPRPLFAFLAEKKERGGTAFTWPQ
ncbi:MAG TPA: hypothetical protein VJ032_07805 [Thermoanaerobaculia bacterium]|nr:hypothetical protein [Thermoanaerobaculia bacterium]